MIHALVIVNANENFYSSLVYQPIFACWYACSDAYEPRVFRL